MRTKIPLIIFVVIVAMALVLRLYQLGKVPPSISWDEASVGYNAYTIANWGRDEWGKKFPLAFKAFGEYKLPVHIYITSIFVKVLGLTDFAVRLPAALFGVGNVILIYFLGNHIFKKKFVGVVAAFLLAISPYNLQFSRQNHELNFAIFFLMLGLWFFIMGVEGKKKYVPISFLCFGLDTITYNGSKIVVPVLVLVMIILYIRDFLKNKKPALFGLFIYLIFLSSFLMDRNLLGIDRLKQVSVSQDDIKSTEVYKKTGNLIYGRLSLIGSEYLLHFKDKFLFVSGDRNPRHSIQAIGEFYKIERLFLAVGALMIFVQIFIRRNKKCLILLAWILLGPLPASLVAFGEAPHTGRAMYMMGGWNLLSALGAYYIIVFFRKWYLQIPIGIALFLLIDFQFNKYIIEYYNVYPLRYAIEWQYGMKQIVEASRREGIYSVFVTEVRSQPYIFFLYYQKYPLPDLLKTVRYNNTVSKSFSTVKSFGNYQFSDWDWVEAIPDDSVLYAVTPPQFTGLRNRLDFSQVEIVKFPDGLPAFYLVSGKKELEL